MYRVSRMPTVSESTSLSRHATYERKDTVHFTLSCQSSLCSAVKHTQTAVWTYSLQLCSWNHGHRQTHPELEAAGCKSSRRRRNWLSGNTHASYWNPKVHRGQEYLENTGAVICSMDPRSSLSLPPSHSLSPSLSVMHMDCRGHAQNGERHRLTVTKAGIKSRKQSLERWTTCDGIHLILWTVWQ